MCTLLLFCRLLIHDIGYEVVVCLDWLCFVLICKIVSTTVLIEEVTRNFITRNSHAKWCHFNRYVWDCVLGYYVKIQRNWCTVTVVPTIEHYGGHSRTPADQRLRPGAREESASPAWLAAPAMNARDPTKVYMWRLETGCGSTLYRKCHSHNTPGKRHNNTWVEPLVGNCTTSCHLLCHNKRLDCPFWNPLNFLYFMYNIHCVHAHWCLHI